ncbi:hypothetical protein FRX31_028626 [Thalictrum thalictroides]|uniref:Uncharacterized protein n=1 Tax=Thalictrum thalictroides TaxID=46969 RepID=A0A7J6V9R4_THATH|nr:hypothetical protein FRX31_028626 [Thalictrum thalictroides]
MRSKSRGSRPPGFDSKGTRVQDSNMCRQNVNKDDMIVSLLNCQTNGELQIFSDMVGIPLAPPLIGVSKRVDRTYGEKDFTNFVLNQKKISIGGAKV